MPKIIFLFLMFVLLVSCNKSTNTKDITTKLEAKNNYNTVSIGKVSDSITEFLISACVSDLKKQKHLSNIQFRNSHVGIKGSKIDEKVYILCGEFKAEPENVWISFATIKTEIYEQWQGAQSLSFCKDSTVIWEERDLSKLLNKKLIYPNN